MAFDGQSGVFRLTPPVGFTGEFEVQVIARDSEGREVTAKFKLFVKPQPITQGRESFSEQIRWAARREGPMAGLLSLQAGFREGAQRAIGGDRVSMERLIPGRSNVPNADASGIQVSTARGLASERPAAGAGAEARRAPATPRSGA